MNLPAPIGAHRGRRFSVFVRQTPGTSTESKKAPEGPGDHIMFEDIGVLSQMGEANARLNERHQIHLPVDNVGLEYRKGLRSLGLTGR